jgi:hypothetical protein
VTPILSSSTTAFVIASHTLEPGSTIEVNGETLTIAQGGSAILIASSHQTRTDSIAAAIISALETSTSSTSSTESGLIESTHVLPSTDLVEASSTSSVSTAGVDHLVFGSSMSVGALIALAAWL